jgi:starvation-inducible DNA-binding protein
MSNRIQNVVAVKSGHLHPTRNTLPLDARHQSVEILNRVVIHSIDVALSAKHAHWNVRGPNFTAYHTLFDRVFTELVGHVDHLGERAAAMGGIARGTVQAVADETRLKPYPIRAVSEADHVEHLAARLGQLGGEIGVAITACARIDDSISVDVLTQAGAAVDSLLWLLESHQARA